VNAETVVVTSNALWKNQLLIKAIVNNQRCSREHNMMGITCDSSERIRIHMNLTEITETKKQKKNKK